MNDSLEEIRESVKDDKSVAGMREALRAEDQEEEEGDPRRTGRNRQDEPVFKGYGLVSRTVRRKYSLKKFPQAYILDTCRGYI